jgi:hypothetical protein
MSDNKKAASAGTGTASNIALERFYSSTKDLLSRLEKVRQTGADTWQACCPAHPDRTASLSIRVVDDRTLIHCFAGCAAHEVLTAIGFEMSDLFPPRQRHSRSERRPFPAADALRAVAFEALVVSAAASAMHTGLPLTAVDRERLSMAATRIQAALSAVMPQSKGVRHG